LMIARFLYASLNIHCAYISRIGRWLFSACLPMHPFRDFHRLLFLHDVSRYNAAAYLQLATLSPQSLQAQLLHRQRLGCNSLFSNSLCPDASSLYKFPLTTCPPDNICYFLSPRHSHTAMPSPSLDWCHIALPTKAMTSSHFCSLFSSSLYRSPACSLIKPCNTTLVMHFRAVSLVSWWASSPQRITSIFEI
jgi:hypothetical protein